jgi:hypothetical protein
MLHTLSTESLIKCKLTFTVTMQPRCLTHLVALRPDAPYFIILLCLTPDNFTRQAESAGT